MPEIGRDDREYWLKLLMRLAIDAHGIGVSLFEEEKVLDIDGSVRKAKKEIYSFECDCNARNVRLINSAALSKRQRKLMKLRYIKKRPWSDVFPLMDTTLRYTYKMHKRALQRILAANTGEDFKRLYNAEKARFDALNPYVSELE